MKNLNSLDNRGVLILEALLAVVILAIGITALSRAFAAGVRAAEYSAEYTRAVSLLEEEIRNACREPSGLMDGEHLKKIAVAVEWTAGKEKTMAGSVYCFFP